jgi:hypothetical protein
MAQIDALMRRQGDGCHVKAGIHEKLVQIAATYAT